MTLDLAAPCRAIEAILQSDLGPRFFEDGFVRWRQGRDDRPAKTMAEADAESRRLVNLLRRLGPRDDDALDLSDRLAACSTDEPCVSGTCPRCSLASQRVLVRAARNLLRREGGRWAMITAVHARSAIRYGDLANHDPFELTRQRLRRALRELPARAFGGLEISANEHEQGAFHSRYVPHAHVFVKADRMRHRDDLFRRHFAPARWTPKPVMVKAFDGRSRGLAYAFKPDLRRRDTLEPRLTSDGSHSRQSSRVKPVRQLERTRAGARSRPSGSRRPPLPPWL